MAHDVQSASLHFCKLAVFFSRAISAAENKRSLKCNSWENINSRRLLHSCAERAHVNPRGLPQGKLVVCFSRANAYTINTATAASPRITAISWAGDGNQTCKDDKNIIAVNLWPVRCEQGKDCFWRGHQLQFRSRFGYFRCWSSKRHISYLYCKLKSEPLKTSVLRRCPCIYGSP